jgi:hypothetical protein
VPQRADLLGLTPGGKGRGSYRKRDELLEMLDAGITVASLPHRDRFP